MYETILVPTDGSGPANRAVEHAIELADHYDAELHAMYVVDTARYGDPALSSAELVLTDLEEEGNEMLEEVVERGQKEGIGVTTVVCHGHPHDEIVAYADDVDADVIVLGYQGESHSETNIMGSVTQRVLQSTDRAVLTT